MAAVEAAAATVVAGGIDRPARSAGFEGPLARSLDLSGTARRPLVEQQSPGSMNQEPIWSTSMIRSIT